MLVFGSVNLRIAEHSVGWKFWTHQNWVVLFTCLSSFFVGALIHFAGESTFSMVNESWAWWTWNLRKLVGWWCGRMPKSTTKQTVHFPLYQPKDSNFTFPGKLTYPTYRRGWFLGGYEESSHKQDFFAGVRCASPLETWRSPWIASG